MERLTQRNKDGELYLFDKNTPLEELMNIAIDILGAYEDTGFTSEEVKNIISANSNIMDFVIKHREFKNKYGTLLEVFDKTQKDRDYWELEAKKWCNQLAYIRKWLDPLGITLEEVLKEAEEQVN